MSAEIDPHAHDEVVTAEESAEVFADADAYDEPECLEPNVSGSVVGSAVSSLDADYAEVSLSAIASTTAGVLDANGSAIGLARIDGDVDITFSAVGLATVQGNASLSQSYVSGFVASDNLNVSQAATAAALARTITFEQGGAAVAVSGDTTVRRGFVGLLLSGKTDIAEDSRVLISGWGLAVLAVAVLGGFGIVALAMGHGAHRLAEIGKNVHLPEWARHTRKRA